jgi:hypothetical protein
MNRRLRKGAASFQPPTTGCARGAQTFVKAAVKGKGFAAGISLLAKGVRVRRGGGHGPQSIGREEIVPLVATEIPLAAESVGRQE